MKLILFLKSMVHKLNNRKNEDIKVIKIFNEIYDTALSKDNLHEAVERIINILSTYYYINHCSIFTYNKDRKSLSILFSTTDRTYINYLEHYFSDLLIEMQARSEQFKIRCTSKPGTFLNYPGAKERKIRYFFFIPLKTVDTLGALLIENNDLAGTNMFEHESFRLVIKNVSVAFQTLLNIQKLTSLNNLDGLTQAYNKTYFMNYFQNKLMECKKYGKIYALAIMDIDYFKKVNDNHGHLFGDKVLKDVSKILKENIRSEEDALARFGGEEFIVLLSNMNAIDAYSKMEKIRVRISEHKFIKDDGSIVYITASFGIADNTNTNSAQEIIECADAALYRAKKSGRNQVRLYNE